MPNSTMPDSTSAPKTFSTIETLAKQLIRRFGKSAARRTCIQNKWFHVLKEIDNHS